jgi:putative DNA primase/helicase
VRYEITKPGVMAVDVQKPPAFESDDFILSLGEEEITTDEKTSSSSSTSASIRPALDTGLVINGVASSPPPKGKRKKRKAVDEENKAEKESKLAGRLADGLHDQLCYDEIGGDWYSQNKGLWSVIPEKKALKIIMRALNAEMPEGYAMSKLNNIKSFLMIILLLDKWEANRYFLPMANGVLNTQTMQLSEYNHQCRFNWQLPYNFEADAAMNVTARWLWDTSGQDLESINVIRAFFKMALVGGDVQKFLELIGSGGTGKSTLIRLLVALIGEKNHTATDLKNLETNNFEAAALYGKRLVIISDSSRYGGEVSVLKALTGGDPVRLEKKNKQQTGSFVFDGVVVVASNEAIQTADYTSGLIRRRMPVNFNRKVSDEDKAKWVAVGGVEAAMRKELPGLLNWVLAMTDDEVKRVIGGINGQMTQAQREHLIDTNKLAAWMDDNIILKADAVSYVGCSMKKKADHDEISKARYEKLYPNYELWCDENAVHPVALQRFTANLIDVCQQLKIDVAARDRNKVGRSISGLAIRQDYHSNYQTPVTKKLLVDNERLAGVEAVMKQSLGSVDGVEGDEVFSFVTNNDDTEFF